MIGVLELMVLLAGVGVVSRVVFRPSPNLDGLRIDGVPVTSTAIELLHRWADRTKRWRRLLGLPTLVLTLSASIVFTQSVNVGIGEHPPWSDPVLMVLLSVFVAGIAAELHHLRRRPGATRYANLTPRDLSDFLPGGARRRQLMLALIAAASTLLAVTVAGQRMPVLGVVALLLAGVVPLVQHGIVQRGRPAVRPALRAADDAVRRLAIRAVDDAGAGAILLLSAWQLAPTYADAGAAGPVEIGMIAAQVAAFVIAVVWWWRSDPNRLLADLASKATTTFPPSSDTS